MSTLSIFSIILATIITVVILCGDVITVNTEIKEKLWFRLYTLYMKIAIVLMVIITIEDIITYISTTTLSIFSRVFPIIHAIVILNKDIAIADSKTKEKKWFKIYTIYMRIMIGVLIFLVIDGMRFWY